MIDLLADAIQAHGGLKRWASHSTLRATVLMSGELLVLKGAHEHPGPQNVLMDLHQPSIMIEPFLNVGRRAEFAAGCVAIKSDTGRLIAQRRDARASFERHDLRTCWDPLHQAYFESYSLWTDLTAPFSLAAEEVECREIDSRRERGELWRGLRATFPLDAVRHSSEEVFYFGSDMLLRRHDYRLEIAGGVSMARYVSEAMTVDGLVIPTRGAVYLRQPDGTAIADASMLAVRLSDLKLAKQDI
ncbi:hypothetical protein [Bradyrhizobium centrosematis]|uniref:hypothetical protein n=1 Tax=Bradyrhizobium centrosematis TaxID=1300039 RepID=UPI0021689106|nr:hypothetical protein [Bradyrhizobium centrosematis]MCS3763115.1 hypothetical protein [Bradyrhizobium centrosematis]MCS3775782.1 hypothetical protein [Bradyrhizobium centrosematis]